MSVCVRVCVCVCVCACVLACVCACVCLCVTLAKSKFYANPLQALMDGQARLSLLKRGEDYIMTMPYANCKGILLGTLTMEMGGKVR